MSITPIGAMPVDTFIEAHRLQREHYEQKKQIEEFHNKKIELIHYANLIIFKNTINYHFLILILKDLDCLIFIFINS